MEQRALAAVKKCEKQLGEISKEEHRLEHKRQQIVAELEQHAAKREELAKKPRISSVAAGSSSAPQAEPYWSAWGLDTFRRLEAWLQQRRAVVLTDKNMPLGQALQQQAPAGRGVARGGRGRAGGRGGFYKRGVERTTHNRG